MFFRKSCISKAPNGQQYWFNHAIRAEIEKSENTSESHMYGIVNAILARQFPVQDLYITRPQNRASFLGGGHGYSDFHTIHYVDDETRCFLITQCKATGYENRDSVWLQAQRQLRDYLGTEHATRDQGERSPAYGMVVNGLGVRFFRYDDDNQEIKRLSPRALDNWWHLKRDHALIQQRLNYIRNNH